MGRRGEGGRERGRWCSGRGAYYLLHVFDPVSYKPNLRDPLQDNHDDDDDTKVRSGGVSNSMEEGWRVQLSSSEATASDYEEVSCKH